MARIVLAHGILGFGAVLPRQPVDYFNRIRALYESLGHEVHCPGVAPLGSLQARATALERQILERWPGGAEPIFMLAHSMGGLDCRRILATNAQLAGRVRRLVTVATPHFGSPVADAVLNPPPLVRVSPLAWFFAFFEEDAGALSDLRSRSALQDPNVTGTEYLCIGCDASHLQPQSPVFVAAAAIGQFGHVANDGVVSLPSSSNTNDPSGLLAVWPVDHGGAIGWPSGGLGHELVRAAANAPPAHLDRYRALLPRLVA